LLDGLLAHGGAGGYQLLWRSPAGEPDKTA
jgi:hypothetical protein